MDVAWEEDLPPDMLAEIERMEKEASRTSGPTPALPPPPPPPPSPVVRYPLPPIGRLPPAPPGSTSSYFQTSQRATVLPPAVRYVSSPQKGLMGLPPPVPGDVEDIEDVEQPGSSSAHPANSSSPSHVTMAVQAYPPPAPVRRGAPPAASMAARKDYVGNHETMVGSPPRSKMLVEFAMHTRALIAVRLLGKATPDRRDELFRAVKQLIDCTEERDVSTQQFSVLILVEWYQAVVDAVRLHVRDVTLHLLYPPVYDICVAKTARSLLPVPDLAKLLPPKLNEILLPFQRQGVEFAVRNGGRALIGDDMGLGKTLQAIATVLCYRKEWPLLVLIPSSVRLQWAEHFEAYVPGLNPEDVNISGKGHLRALINIVSYDLAPKMDLSQHNFKVIICDESHYLKNYDTKRTKVVVPLIQNALRAVLLSGTPALSRPKELWQQISSLNTPLFGSPKSPWAFYYRYCAAYKDHRLGRLNSDGASNLAELHLLLQDSVMIRRLKSEVLTQLPPKRRTEVKLSLDTVTSAKIKQLEKQREAIRAKLGEADTWEKQIDASVDHKGMIMEMFKSTGTVKIPAYVKDLCQTNEKFLIFAYHHDVMDAIEKTIAEAHVEYIRIDGHTAGHHRGEYVKDFQENPNVKAAILGVTAAGVGLNLYAASTVVFAELYWNPGQLQQCEDRAHRIGSTAESVNIYYLVAAKTIDETIWSMLKKKLSVVGSTLNGAAETLSISKTETKAVNRSTGNEFVDTLMEELDTFDERQQAFNKRRKDRKELKAYLKSGKEPDEEEEIKCIEGDQVVDGDVVEIGDGDFEQKQQQHTLKRKADGTKQEDAQPTAPVPQAKPLSSSLSAFALNRRPLAPPTAPVPAPTVASTAPSSPTPTLPRAPASRPMASMLHLFAFTRPNAANSPALNTPVVPSPVAAPAPPAAQSLPAADFSVRSSVSAPETQSGAAEAWPSIVKSKRSKFIADDE